MYLKRTCLIRGTLWLLSCLVRALNDEAYRKKEEAVEMLRRLARTEGGS